MNDVKIVRSARRTISITINSDASVTVGAPYLVPSWEINRFLKEKEKWIRDKQQEMQIRLAQVKNVDRDEYLYLGKAYPLAFRNQKNLIELSDKLYLGIANKKYLKTYLESWYKQQARKIIVERVYHYAKIAGLQFNEVKLTSAETRWGSCSSDRNLNFNWKLIMAPLEVIDYVIAHELAHLTEMNHSADFWETVRKMYPLYRQYRTWLKRHGHTLTI